MSRLMIAFLSLFVIAVACKKKEAPLENEEETEEVIHTSKQVILLEPTTSVNCGACPLAHHEIEEIEAEYEDVTHISHYLFGLLYHPYTDYLMEKIDKTVYTPLGHINRRHEEGSVVYYPVNMFKSQVIKEQEEGMPIELVLDVKIAEGTLELDLDASTTIEDFKDQMMVTAIVAEKEVVGEGNGYDQRNYGNDDPDHPYYERGDYIEGFKHTNIIREVLTPFEGEMIDLSTGSASWSATLDLDELEGEATDHTVIVFINRTGDIVQPILNAVRSDILQ